jgi:dipeptidyl aminopeptidase/acylaminoacyl peptidase
MGFPLVYLVTLILILLALLLIIIALLIVFSILVAGKIVKPQRIILSWTPRDLGFEYEDFIYKTRDGVDLKGWLVKGGGEKAIVLIHGLNSSRWDEYCVKPAMKVLGERGYSVLVVDMRAHGVSGGEITTLGYKESDDVAEIVNILRSRGFKKIAIYGFSMGGAISIITATKTLVDAVIVDSPYVNIVSSGRRLVRRVKGLVGYMLRLSYPLVVKIVEARVGFSLGELMITMYAKRVKAPVLMVAPLRDHLITVDEYKALYEELKKSSPNVEAWFVDSEHVEAWQRHSSEYVERLLNFLSRYM